MNNKDEIDNLSLKTKICSSVYFFYKLIYTDMELQEHVLAGSELAVAV